MKHVKHIFRNISIAFLLLIPAHSAAQIDLSHDEQHDDSVAISLLTCAPGSESYSLYGHTAIRYQDLSTGTDIVVNYGMFSFKQRFFVLRFIFGLTDYYMGITTFQDFCYQYAWENRTVKQQVLNLSAHEKAKIAKAIDANYLPENRTYRYNIFYKNCTTLARDILLNNVEDSIKFNVDSSEVTTYRELVHQCIGNKAWERFGVDLLLGVNADKPITYRQQQFLPLHLFNDFNHAKIIGKEHQDRPLVAATETIIQCDEQEESAHTALPPIACAVIFAVIIITVSISEIVFKKNFWVIDIIIMGISGLAGIILFAMIFSKHPTVQVNLQILFLNPLNLFFIVPATKKWRKRQFHRWLNAWLCMLAAFLLGNLIQSYAEGTNLMVLTIMARLLYKRYVYSRPKR